MFDFARKRAVGSRSETAADRPRSRQPVTIGFEQLEGREMLSTGLFLTIIPDPSRPMMTMPRPYIGSLNPESSASTAVSMAPRVDPPEDREPARPWLLGGRFRWRGLGRD
jgi:hypothetical protein